jgi:hypothetical protein
VRLKNPEGRSVNSISVDGRLVISIKMGVNLVNCRYYIQMIYCNGVHVIRTPYKISGIRPPAYKQNITPIGKFRLPHKEGQLTILSKFLGKWVDVVRGRGYKNLILKAYLSEYAFWQQNSSCIT